MQQRAADVGEHGPDDDPTWHAERGRRARTLRERLTALPLRIARARCHGHDVDLPSYPDGPRPSSLALLEGAGVRGVGEHVGWSGAAHAAFAAHLATLALDRCRTVGELAGLARAAFDEPYDRAALEAAAIDLALRQGGTSPFRLCGVAPAPLRYVLSFERVADPVARAAAELRRAPGVELKIDADPDWTEATLAGLAALGRVRVLDFKLSGPVAAHERAHRLLPAALIEDPLPGASAWSASLRAHLSLDATIRSVDVVPATGAARAVNVKPARIGGVLAALDVVATCAARGIDVYFGGMFEVGPGRAQLHALAALLCPHAPNDVAPLERGTATAVRPARLQVADDDGFAALPADGPFARSAP
jgi:L-alanine-DL-glutamate epimerase-like enolase superfamily enzyme